MSQNGYPYPSQQPGDQQQAPRRRSRVQYDQPEAAPQGYERPAHNGYDRPAYQGGYQQAAPQGHAQMPPRQPQQPPQRAYPVPAQLQPYGDQPPARQAYSPAAPQSNPSSAPVQNVVVNVNANAIAGDAGAGESYFDGKLHQQIGYAILGFLITVFTLGLCFPWAVCMQYGWKVKHTVIGGRRLAFDGKATQLFGRWLLWMLLTVITFGIYAFWVGIALEKWRVKHTYFAR